MTDASALTLYDVTPLGPRSAALRTTDLGKMRLLVTAVEARQRLWTGYTTDLGRGTRGSFLVEHPDFALPPATAQSVRRTVQRFVMDPANRHGSPA